MQKREKFRHFKQKDRDRIHALYMEGHFQKTIAEILGVSPSAISRELHRYNKKTWRYDANKAEKDAKEKRKNSKRIGTKIENNLELKEYIITELKNLRSPDEIAGRMRLEKLHPSIGTKAIYTWLYSKYGKPYCKYLCTKRTHRKGQNTHIKRSLIPDRISIENRPDSKELLHAEGDLFVSPISSKSKACGLLVVANESKLLLGNIVPSKQKVHIVPTMQNITKNLSPDTYTFDNGIENINHREFGTQAYFCDKGSPWQKPHVEGSIGLIRRWFIPKGTNLSLVSNETFQIQLNILNHKYRKSLGYRSSYEYAYEHDIIKQIPERLLIDRIAFE